MNYTYPICDYITVFPVLGDIIGSEDGSTSVININPAQYSSNAKSDYCLMSLADASLDHSNEEEPIALVLRNPTPQNNQAESPVLGHFSITATSGRPPEAADIVYHHSFVPNNVKYLVPARPSQISFTGRTSRTQSRVGFTQGYMTFKFEYLSKEQVNALNSQSNYTTF